MNTSFSILTFNIHKGKTLTRRPNLPLIRDALIELSPNLVFLQEVVGERKGIQRFQRSWHAPQHEYLAAGHWPYHVYGKNLTHRYGHHGNCLLSQFPILSHQNVDVSAYRFERRGVLCSKLLLEGERPIYCFCLHFALLRKGRRKQIEHLITAVKSHAEQDSPIIIAGDFNDWTRDCSAALKSELGLREVFDEFHGHYARTFPRRFPLLALDRIYFRGLKLHHAQSINFSMSDHRALWAQFESK